MDELDWFIFMMISLTFINISTPAKKDHCFSYLYSLRLNLQISKISLTFDF
jgi:hypothetical protein